MPTPSDVLDNIRSALARDLPPFLPHVTRKEPLIVCGGGPSLKRSIPHIRRRQQKGGKVIAANGAHDYLIERHVKPWACILWDWSAGFLDGITLTPQPGVIYFVASQCGPAVLDRLAGFDVVLWHAHAGIGEEAVLDAWGGPWALIPGGMTAPLRAIDLGEAMGFRSFDLYGVDGSYEGRRHHAYGQPREDALPTYEVTIEGKSFFTRDDLALQAPHLGNIAARLPHVSIRVHGDGLVPHAWRYLNADRSGMVSVV